MKALSAFRVSLGPELNERRSQGLRRRRSEPRLGFLAPASQRRNRVKGLADVRLETHIAGRRPPDRRQMQHPVFGEPAVRLTHDRDKSRLRQLGKPDEQGFLVDRRALEMANQMAERAGAVLIQT